MKKLPDWEIAFDEYIIKNRTKPFVWGKWDCIHFTNGFIKVMTKESLLPKNWKWKDEDSAIKKIKEYGKGKGLANAIANAIKKTTGIIEVNPNFIQKGDFGVYKEESELSCVFDGMNALGVNDEGMVVKNNVEVVKAWRING